MLRLKSMFICEQASGMSRAALCAAHVSRPEGEAYARMARLFGEELERVTRGLMGRSRERLVARASTPAPTVQTLTIS